MRSETGDIDVSDRVETEFFWPTLFHPVRADPSVVHDPIEPCSDIGASLKAVESLVRVHHGVLHQILGINFPTRESPGRAEEGGTVRHGITFEPLGQCRG